ncbi:MAG: hypothetical protein J0M34_06570 [Alphaproteobacteria bacterium]|nr:hypothetical protein [Alphaproteobacteria bacterium]
MVEKPMAIIKDPAKKKTAQRRKVKLAAALKRNMARRKAAPKKAGSQ